MKAFFSLFLGCALAGTLLAQDATNVDTPRIRQLTTRLASAPNDALALSDRAHAYALLGLKALAINDANEAAALAPNDELILRHLGWTLFNLQEYTYALQFWLRASELAGYRESWHNYTVALGYWGMHDLVRATYFYDRAVAQENSFGEAKSLTQRTDFWTVPEKRAIATIFDAWRRGYKATESE